MPHTPNRNPSPSLSDIEIERLQGLLDAIPAPFEPLDVSALDGFLVGVALQRPVVAADLWMRHVVDVEGREPAVVDPAIRTLVLRRYAELDGAIERREWFDPWVFELDDAGTPSETVMGWVAGFATAMDLFPCVMQHDPAQTLEPLAQLYAHLDPDDLEDADDLLEAVETLEPPRDLPEAVESLVRATLLLADATRPTGAPAARSRTRSAPPASRRRQR